MFACQAVVQALPLDLGRLILVFLEAALAADLITASKSLRGGCASSRLDHGSFKMDQEAFKKILNLAF